MSLSQVPESGSVNGPYCCHFASVEYSNSKAARSGSRICFCHWNGIVFCAANTVNGAKLIPSVMTKVIGFKEPPFVDGGLLSWFPDRLVVCS